MLRKYRIESVEIKTENYGSYTEWIVFTESDEMCRTHNEEKAERIVSALALLDEHDRVEFANSIGADPRGVRVTEPAFIPQLAFDVLRERGEADELGAAAYWALQHYFIKHFDESTKTDEGNAHVECAVSK